MKHIVNQPDGSASLVWSDPRSDNNVILSNASAVDVYLDAQPNRLNQAVPGAVPDGLKLPAAVAGVAGQIVWVSAPPQIWARAVSQVTIEVQPK